MQINNFRGTKYNENLLSSPKIVRRRMNFLVPKIIVLFLYTSSELVDKHKFVLWLLFSVDKGV